MAKDLSNLIGTYVPKKIWLLVYYSDYNCDSINGVYITKQGAITAAIKSNKNRNHDGGNCNDMCECDIIREIPELNTRSTLWGPATEIGIMYVIEHNVINE